jgi:hypothetical protein
VPFPGQFRQAGETDVLAWATEKTWSPKRKLPVCGRATARRGGLVWSEARPTVGTFGHHFLSVSRIPSACNPGPPAVAFRLGSKRPRIRLPGKRDILAAYLFWPVRLRSLEKGTGTESDRGVSGTEDTRSCGAGPLFHHPGLAMVPGSAARRVKVFSTGRLNSPAVRARIHRRDPPSL